MSAQWAPSLDEQRSAWLIVRDALALYGRYPVLFVVLAVVVVAPYDLFVLDVAGTSPLGGSAHQSFALGLLLNLIHFSLVGPFISALHTHAVVLAGEGAKPRLRTVAARGLLVLPVVMAAEIVSNLGIYVGFLLVVPGIILAFRWSVVAQAAAVEQEGWIPSLSSSARLTSGNYLRMLGLFALTGIPILAIRLGARTLPLGGSSTTVSVAVGILIDTVTASFAALTLALLYFDLRARQTRHPVRAAT